MIKYIILASICACACEATIDSAQDINSVQENITIDSASFSDDVTSNGDATTDVNSDG